MASTSAAALPYHEPSIVTILILSAFLLALNIGNHVFDRFIACGLVGQIFVGIAWGTPGAKWLSAEAEIAIVNLGYLGLLLLVYEGGISTSWKSLRANLVLSSTVALTGIALPITLSYVLMSLTNATSLQAFAAGAALCSTSLGTTFTVLASNGLSHTRMGVVLTSAAMLDDVVGLVMVQVISNLGAASSSFSATTVLRPLFVSIAFLVSVPLVCRLVVKPLKLQINGWRAKGTPTLISNILLERETALLCHTGILLAMITGASYAGTSNLLAAYLAGAAISWWDSELSQDKSTHASRGETIEMQPINRPTRAQQALHGHSEARPSLSTEQLTSGIHVYKHYYAQALQRILKPFFFASIGFSVPISQMFEGEVIWRGLVYSLLVFLGKFVCGLWLIRIPGSKMVPGTKSIKNDSSVVNTRKPSEGSTRPTSSRPMQEDLNAVGPDSINDAHDFSSQQPRPNEGKKLRQTASSSVLKPVSLYPACILGSAMTARGEIGFLISSLAESKGIFAQDGKDNSATFLVITWAILLCTIVGPLCVGLIVKRVRRLEKGVKGSNHSRGAEVRSWVVLGQWGVG